MDGASYEFLTRTGLAGDYNGSVRRSNLGYKREYLLQGGRSSDDLVVHWCLIDFFAQSDVLVFESVFRLLWIRDEYCDARHELPPNLGTLHAW